MSPACEAELSDKAEKSTQRSKLGLGYVTTICYSSDVVSRQVVACSPILRPVWDSRQTITSATTSEVWNRPIIVSMKFDHRHAARRATHAVNQIVCQDSVWETHSIRVACLCVVGSRMGRKCVEHC